jgi:hypothetical protein
MAAYAKRTNRDPARYFAIGDEAAILDRIAEYVDVGCKRALSGRRGPVVLQIPQEYLSATLSGPGSAAQPAPLIARPAADPAQIAQAAALLREMYAQNISTRVFDSGLAVSNFRDNSTRTRFSFASAANLLGLTVQDLDEGKSQIAHGETVRETATMISFLTEVIGIRDDMFLGAETGADPATFVPAALNALGNDLLMLAAFGVYLQFAKRANDTHAELVDD